MCSGRRIALRRCSSVMSSKRRSLSSSTPSSCCTSTSSPCTPASDRPARLRRHFAWTLTQTDAMGWGGAGQSGTGRGTGHMMQTTEHGFSFFFSFFCPLLCTKLLYLTHLIVFSVYPALRRHRGSARSGARHSVSGTEVCHLSLSFIKNRHKPLFLSCMEVSGSFFIQPWFILSDCKRSQNR